MAQYGGFGWFGMVHIKVDQDPDRFQIGTVASQYERFECRTPMELTAGEFDMKVDFILDLIQFGR